MNTPQPLSDDGLESSGQFSSREREVLSVVLELMVEEGDGFSMATVAKRASCSKETLYRWFGDRDGLLTALVRWQASKVAMPELDEAGLTEPVYFQTLEAFSTNWLEVLSGDVSIALNRLAVSHAGSGNSNLGQILLVNGPLAMRERLLPIFEIGNRKGFVKLDEDGAFRVFFGLVIGDMQIRVLLGDKERPGTNEITQISHSAVEHFRTLYGNNKN